MNFPFLKNIILFPLLFIAIHSTAQSNITFDAGQVFSTFKFTDAQGEQEKGFSNNISGCFSLGYYEEESGSKKMAYDLYKKSCDGKYYVACYNLGYLAMKEGKDELARKYLKLACDMKLADGCNNLGNLEAKYKKMVMAISYYKKSCDLGDQMGCLSLKMANGKK